MLPFRIWCQAFGVQIIERFSPLAGGFNDEYGALARYGGKNTAQVTVPGPVEEALAERAADFCFRLFPDGNVRYGKFYVGNLHGDAGKSLVITVDGSRTGMRKDFATGEGGSILLELLFRKLFLPKILHSFCHYLTQPYGSSLRLAVPI
ncbi:MAG: hypothetical protein LBD72_01645 [Puniceicoccales bacterium]|nr:hypothetical protein [Puniceicoccales bacterium]